MNTIGRMGKGQWAYYQDAVAAGREDYYTAGANRPGVWQGRGAEALQLTGEVVAEDVAAVFNGDNPRTGGRLVDDPRWKRPGYDLTFRGSKSISVLWALADADTRRQVDGALDRANAGMVGWLEDKIAFGRVMGADGQPERVRGTGLTVATYAHNVSRNLDPHLHRHNLVLNALERPGRRGLTVGALDAQLLYAYARPAGFVGQRLLRQELTKTLGVRWTRTLQQDGRQVDATVGTAEIEGLQNRGMLQAFSTRHAEVQEQLAAMGYTSAAAGALASERTRQAKADPENEVPMPELDARWRATAAGFGLGEFTPASVMGGPVQLRAATEADVALAFDRLQSAEGLTKQASTFNQRDVVMGLCEVLPDDVEVTAPELDRLSQRFIDERAILVGVAGTDAAVRTCDVIRVGEKARMVGADETRYTTPEMLATETSGILGATTAVPAQVAPARAVQSAVEKRTLLAEQAAVTVALARSGLRVQTVVGEAGTGKTYALDAVREVWEGEGRPVIGIALSARATQQLRDAHIHSEDLRTVASFKSWLAHGGRIPEGALVVVDEAGVVGTRDLVAVQESVLAADGQLVLVGDTEQLTEIDAGGYFRSLHRRLSEQVPGYREAHELHTVIRQRDPLDIEALRALRQGDAEAAVHNLDDRGLVFEGADSREAARQMVADWAAARDSGKDVLMLARQRQRVHELNALAQGVRRQRGELGEQSVPLGGQQRLHVGDEVLFRQAIKGGDGVDIVNGTPGRVTQVDPDSGAALIAYGDHPQAWVDSNWLTGVRRDGTEFVQLGYAGTGHVYQGATTGVGLAFISDDADRQWAYTVLSRHRDEVRMYAVAEPSWVERSEEEMHGTLPAPESRGRLAGVIEAMGRDSSKQTALDVLEAQRGQGAEKPSPRRQRAQDLLDKRREEGRLSIRELTELQRLQRLLRHGDDPKRDQRQESLRQREQQRHREDQRDREREP
ncbi:MAG: MobF family relaxase [Candidatus Dormibacteria bacterium]